VRDETDPQERTLRLEGAIAEESWFDDEISPKIFRQELFDGDGPITVWINSPGGDCVAAAQIYNMLMDYPHDITVKVDGIAASAASVIAMAGTRVIMTPVSLMMIHNPLTVAMGDSDEMRRAIQLLDEVKESILNAYEIKTGLSRARLSHLMDGETWMNAKKALELGFCDEIAFLPESEDDDQAAPKDSFTFSRRAVTNCLMDKLRARMPAQPEADPAAATDTTNPTDPVNAEPPTPDASRVFVSDDDPKLQLIRYQLLWEGLPHE
jgi:ATP-dependent Clp protease protease subunit